MYTEFVNKGMLESIGSNPARFLEYPLWLVQLLGGLWILSPFYLDTTEGTGIIARTFASILALKIYGGSLAVIGGIGLYARLKAHWPMSVKLRRFASFYSFIFFLYLTLLRILTQGIGDLGWISYFLNACMIAAIYLRLKWEEG